MEKVEIDPKKKKMTFFQEFKEFAVKGDVIDLAIGFILGAGFTSLVQSFVTNIIMPPIGQLLGKANFINLYINLSGIHYDTLADAEKAGVAVIKYGLFITQLINFLILSLVVFVVLKLFFKSYFKKKDEKKPEAK
jgi:large conductance mechanosensitive channel